MQSLLKSLAGLLVAVLLVSGGIIASFGFSTTNVAAMSDSRRPTLKIISGDSKVCAFQVFNAMPGTNGCNNKRIINVGNRTGLLGVCFSTVGNTPGTTGEYEDGSGDLGANTEIAAYIDVDASGDWNTGDIGLRSDGSTYCYPAGLDYSALNNYSGNIWNELTSMSASDVCAFNIEWRIPGTVGNEIQGDSVDFDITFMLNDSI
jgi:hypothetical protein